MQTAEASTQFGQRAQFIVKGLTMDGQLSIPGCEISPEPQMKETAEDKAVRESAYGVAAGELQQFVERYERLEAEKQEVADQQKEVMAEAKGRGYDTKILRKIVALRKREPDDIAEEEAILDMYKAALGMA